MNEAPIWIHTSEAAPLTSAYKVISLKEYSVKIRPLWQHAPIIKPYFPFPNGGLIRGRGGGTLYALCT